MSEEHAALLERHIVWLQGKVDESSQEERKALKIGSNVAHQAAFGFIPFPEAASVPPREKEIREVDQDYGDPVARARADFKESEMKYYRRNNSKGLR